MPAARASIDRSESQTLVDGSALQILVVELYSGADARDARGAADTDVSGSVTALESAAFADNETQRRLGNQSQYVRWDGGPTVWRNVSAAVTGMEGPANSGSSLSLSLDGVLALTSAEAENHTLTITRPPGFASWNVTLVIPSTWSFGNVSGVSGLNQSGSSLSATVDEGVAVFAFVAPPPPPPSGVFRNESYVLINSSVAQYAAVEVHLGPDAVAARASADTDFDGNVSAGEAAAHMANESEVTRARLGAGVRWDGLAAPANPLSVTAEGLEGEVNGSTPVNFTVEALLTLNSGSAQVHTFTITRPAGFAGWHVSISVASAWEFGASSGTSSVNQTTSRLEAEVSPGVAVFAIKSPPPVAPLPASDGLLLVALAALGIGAAALGIVVRGRRRLSSAEAAAESASHQPKYVLEGFLLLYRDGRLLHHQEARGSGRLTEPEILGSMFAAVSDFIRDSFREDSTHSRLTLGNNTILLERTAHLFGAAVIYGEPDGKLREEIDDALQRVEGAYTGVVEKWSGDRHAFDGAGPLLAPLFALTAGVSREQVRAAAVEKAVKLLSETEHYRGYIRLKVAITNDTPDAIGDAEVTVNFNEDVLRLARIDPAAFVRRGAAVKVGAVKPGERMCVNYLLDPQTCNQTNIEGKLTYRDAAGGHHATTMKVRHAEIVCPIFFTPEQANAATLQRKMETSLPVRDGRSFRVMSLPAGASFADLFGVARDAVQRHDVRLVRSISTPPPFEGKAWFFGQTKVGGSDVVVRASALEHKNEVEYFVATDSPASLTGLLAELNRSFREILNKRLPGAIIEPIFEETLDIPAPP